MESDAAALRLVSVAGRRIDLDAWAADGWTKAVADDDRRHYDM